MLTIAEQESAAYLAGDTRLAAVLAELEDTQQNIEDLADRLEQEFSRGYAEGEREASDADLATRVETAESELAKMKDTMKTFSDAIKRIELELVGDGGKTIAGRRSMAKALQTMRWAYGVF